MSALEAKDESGGMLKIEMRAIQNDRVGYIDSRIVFLDKHSELRDMHWELVSGHSSHRSSPSFPASLRGSKGSSKINA